MLVNPKSLRIMLYGDSIVYGKVSGKNERLPINIRFSGVMQNLLGDDFDVIEEGLRARMIEGDNAFFPDRDGLKQFSAILGSHLPLDLVVIFLGTNDCNAGSNRTPEQIADSLRKYAPIINEWSKFLAIAVPKLLIIAPPKINEEYYDETMKKIFGEGAGRKAAALPDIYKKVASDLGAEFFNSAEVCEPASGDGIHLDQAGNSSLAKELAVVIKKILG